jgi:hypothetical protein
MPDLLLLGDLALAVPACPLQKGLALATLMP